MNHNLLKSLNSFPVRQSDPEPGGLGDRHRRQDGQAHQIEYPGPHDRDAARQPADQERQQRSEQDDTAGIADRQAPAPLRGGKHQTHLPVERGEIG